MAFSLAIIKAQVPHKISLKPENEAMMLGKIMSQTSHGGMWTKEMNNTARLVHKEAHTQSSMPPSPTCHLDIRQISNPAPGPAPTLYTSKCCVTLQILLNHSVPPFPHPLKRNNYKTYLPGLLRDFK